MQCSVCKKEIEEGEGKCHHCGAQMGKSELQKSSQQVWWKYSVFADKSVDRLDQILFFVYLGFAFYMPISAIVSLVLIHVVRKKNLNDVYRTAATVVIVGIAIFSMVVTFVRSAPK